MRSRFFLLLWPFLQAATARADSLLQPPDRFWAVLASRQDIDQAIGVAQAQRQAHAIVTRASNGWFAVVSGPHAVRAGTGSAFLDTLIKEHAAPKDTYLTRGGGFDGVVWTAPATGVKDTIEYDGEHDVVATKGELTLTLSRRRDEKDKDQNHATLSATVKGKWAFSTEMVENSSEKPASKIELVQLDPTSPFPEIVFSYFWQGAHCCTVTKIATAAVDNSWRVIDADVLDGDGYAFEDQGGFSHLISIDNAFLYAFDGYAGSYAPIRLQRFQGGALKDVTREEALRHRVLQDFYRMDQSAGNDAETRGSHGFLAGWVAASFLAGRDNDAWKTMLATYDRGDSMFGPETCSIRATPAKCPEDKKVKLPFPASLRLFLTEHGYMLDPNRYAVPDEIVPTSTGGGPELNRASASPQLQTCAGAVGTVRGLVYQTFAGRKMSPGESADAVDAAADVTLEGYDSSTRKVTCAVSYTISLRSLIGRLAEEGNMARAASLGRLSRRQGGSVSNRVQFTVKPTASTGTEFVELLP